VYIERVAIRAEDERKYGLKHIRHCEDKDDCIIGVRPVEDLADEWGPNPARSTYLLLYLAKRFKNSTMHHSFS
jgi:hypothetical protein